MWLSSRQRLLPACLDERNSGVLDVMSAIVPLATMLEVPCSYPQIALHSLLTALMLILVQLQVCSHHNIDRLIYCCTEVAGWRHDYSGSVNAGGVIAQVPQRPPSMWRLGDFWRHPPLAWRQVNMVLVQRSYWTPCRRCPVLWWAELTKALLRVVKFYLQCLNDVMLVAMA